MSEVRTQRTRRLGMGLVAVLVVVVMAVWWANSSPFGGDRVATDNAYVHGNVVVVTPQVPGTVTSIQVEETDRVDAGQILVKLDTTDASNALRHKSARLARVVRETRAMYPQANMLRSTLAIRESALERARTELALSSEKLKRRELLQASGMVAREALQDATAAHDIAKNGLIEAESSVAVAREGLSAQLALTAGVVVERHPLVEEAAIEMREAWLATKRAEIRAPLSGFVARRSVQIGQRVQAGGNLMSIVALDRLWVEANFKEDQLRDIRIGQPVTLTADVYGTSVIYRGQVAGLGIGTGAAFALLPPQNATGNWIKILQRVPVRIALDPKTLAEHPLRLGLSMRAQVDTRDRSGPMLKDAPRLAPVVETKVFDELALGADEAVQRVIDSHMRPETRRPARMTTEGASTPR